MSFMLNNVMAAVLEAGHTVLLDSWDSEPRFPYFWACSPLGKSSSRRRRKASSKVNGKSKNRPRRARLPAFVKRMVSCAEHLASSASGGFLSERFVGQQWSEGSRQVGMASGDGARVVRWRIYAYRLGMVLRESYVASVGESIYVLAARLIEGKCPTCGKHLGRFPLFSCMAHNRKQQARAVSQGRYLMLVSQSADEETRAYVRDRFGTLLREYIGLLTDSTVLKLNLVSVCIPREVNFAVRSLSVAQDIIRIILVLSGRPAFAKLTKSSAIRSLGTLITSRRDILKATLNLLVSVNKFSYLKREDRILFVDSLVILTGCRRDAIQTVIARRQLDSVELGMVPGRNDLLNRYARRFQLAVDRYNQWLAASLPLKGEGSPVSAFTPWSRDQRRKFIEGALPLEREVVAQLEHYRQGGTRSEGKPFAIAPAPFGGVIVPAEKLKTKPSDRGKGSANKPSNWSHAQADIGNFLGGRWGRIGKGDSVRK
jgi:hypothetical protein